MNYTKQITLFSLFFMLFSTTAVMAKPIIELEDNKDNYTQTADGYILNFTLAATATDLAAINEQIAATNGNVVMTTELISEGSYKCVYTITHQNHPEYVHKMLLVSGFQEMTYKGDSYDIQKIIEILYSYLDNK